MTHSGGSSPANNNVPAPQRKRFSLTGRTVPIDLRVDAVRGDLADVELADRVFAPHYAKSCAFTVTQDTELRATASAEGEVITKLKAGERFGLLDVSGDWGWGKCSGVVGYVSAKMIEPV
ncbi:MAG: hypothetical protein JWL66_271 [Sphingomonadales bacterium]|nr:hypothetical protein [Sphingomonadales bacterium]